MPETIDLLLKELKLPAFIRHYQHHQEQAIEKGYGHVRYLSGLCEQEAADRYQKRVQKWTREAGLPPGEKLCQPCSGRTHRVGATTDYWAERPVGLGTSCRKRLVDRALGRR